MMSCGGNVFDARQFGLDGGGDGGKRLFPIIFELKMLRKIIRVMKNVAIMTPDRQQKEMKSQLHKYKIPSSFAKE